MRDLSKHMKYITMIGQLGLSLIVPVLMCLGGCYLLVSRLHWPEWIYIIGMLFGLGASFMTAYKMYLAETKKQKKRKTEKGYNRHL